jgi:hypothetical protein
MHCHKNYETIMKKNVLSLLIIFLLLSICSCHQVSLYDDYDGREDSETGQETEEPISPTNKPVQSTIRDLVLISSNLQTYNHPWIEEDWNPYVVWEQGTKKDWLFDGFLFVDVQDNEGHSFMYGHGSSPALKSHWENWANMLFTENKFIPALDASISKYASQIGQPNRKRKVIVSIPEPLQQADQWGELNGKMLNMMNDEDRLTACKWFIDLVEAKFKQGTFANLELEGFYWIAEGIQQTGTIIAPVAEYLREKKFTFIWIPWWKSDDYDDSEKYGFSSVYLQPNYFWNNVEYSRLQEACNEAIKHNINLEIECDESVYGGKGQRLYDYIEVFKKNNIHKTKKLAYYQSINVFGTLGTSKNSSDKQLYDTLCEMIVERQKEENPVYISTK